MADGHILEDFRRMVVLVEEFLYQNVIGNKRERAQLLASRFDDVTANCDSLSFNKPGEAEAYTALHFLDRYHRFQMIFLELLREGVFPLWKYRHNYLDIGTGPAPALYALGDLMPRLRKWFQENDHTAEGAITWDSDYAEMSNGFRDWLHYFTEHCGAQNRWDTQDVRVPFHHGSFRDFKGIHLGKVKARYSARQAQLERQLEVGFWDEEDDEAYWVALNEYNRNWRHEYRYNMILCSYFLTDIEKVASFTEEIRGAAYSLCDKGLLIVVGSTGDKQSEAIKRVETVIESGKYSKKNTKSVCRPVKLLSKELSYANSDPFGLSLRGYYERLCQTLGDLGADKDVEPKVWEGLQKTIKSETQVTKWNVLTIRKYARLRNSMRAKSDGR